MSMARGLRVKVAGSLRNVCRFRDDAAGAITVVFALALIPMMIGGLFAIDYARATSTRGWLQDRLDTAVLAGVTTKGGDMVGAAQVFFRENATDNRHPAVSAVFTINADGSLSGKAQTTLPLVAGGLFSIKSVDLSASASAMRPVTKYQSFTFTPTAAQGAFNKDIYVVTRDSKGNVIKSTLAISYSYNTKTFVRSTSPALGAPLTVSLGPYETVALMMRVWWQNWGTRTGAYEDYYSDASAPKIRTTGTCETGQTNNWEDGGDSNYADFVYTMTCKTTAATGVARLTN